MQKVPLKNPCSLDWQKMTPRDGGRFCGDCKKVVRDLSSLSEDEARALLRAPRNEELCVRYLYDRDGTIVFKDRAPPLLPAALLRRAARAATAAALPLALQACSSGGLAPLSSTNDATEDHTQHDTPNYDSAMGGAMPDPEYHAPAQPDAADGGAQADAGGHRDAGSGDGGKDDDR
jgi:hypothetical protein